MDPTTIVDKSKNFFNVLDSIPNQADKNEVVRATISNAQRTYGLTESEAKGMLVTAAKGAAEEKGLKGVDFDTAIKKQLAILNAGQADEDSFRFWLAKHVPEIATVSHVAGGIVMATRAIEFAKVVIAGGSLAQGFAAMGPIGILAGSLAALGYLLPSILNVSSDYTAMQPTMQLSVLADLKKQQAKEISGFSTYDNTVSRVTTTKTAKPKVYVGTILGGTVGKAWPFVRVLDDEITDEKDLMNDAQINMTNWLMSLPGKITYEIQVKYNPFDENQVRKIGYWITLALYVNNNLNKRLFIDEILLGPINPVKYWPDQQLNTSINVTLPNLLKPTEIKELLRGDGNLTTVDAEGNIIDVFAFNKQAEIQKQMAEAKAKVAELEKIAEDIIKRSSSSTGSSTESKPSSAGSTIQPTLEQLTQAKIDEENKAKAAAAAFTGSNIPAAETKLDTNIGQIAQQFYGGSSTPAPTPTPTPTPAPVSQYPKTVTVIVPALMVRSAPNSSASLAGSQRLSQGESFTVTGKVSGESVDGNNQWWVSQYGNYVWTGGTTS